MKTVTSDCEWLSIGDLNACGVFSDMPATVTLHAISRGRFGNGQVAVRVLGGGVRLQSRTSERDVGVALVPCALGGARPYFVCPRCDRHCSKLMVPEFHCRKCGAVGYASQQRCEHPAARTVKLHRKIYGDLATLPEGMSEDEHCDLVIARLRLEAAKIRERLEASGG